MKNIICIKLIKPNRRNLAFFIFGILTLTCIYPNGIKGQELYSLSKEDILLVSGIYYKRESIVLDVEKEFSWGISSYNPNGTINIDIEAGLYGEVGNCGDIKGVIKKDSNTFIILIDHMEERVSLEVLYFETDKIMHMYYWGNSPDSGIKLYKVGGPGTDN